MKLPTLAFAVKVRTIIAIAVATVAVVAATASSAEAAGTVHGCPSGYVCVYPQSRGWNGDRPSLRFYTYRAHNLSNQFGIHRVFNNQYGGAWAWMCRGYNGTGGLAGTLGAGYFYDFNLTPINSIELAPRTTLGCYRLAVNQRRIRLRTWRRRRRGPDVACMPSGGCGSDRQRLGGRHGRA